MSKKIAYYIRTSTKSESQRTSIENQPKYFNAYIEQQKEDGNDTQYIPVTTYVDWGVSGTNVSRRHFLHMLKDCGIETYIQYTDKNGKKIDRQIILPPRNNDDAPFYDNKYIQSRENIYFKPPTKNCIPPFDEIWCKTTSRFGRSIFQLMDIVEYLNQQKVYVRFIEQNLYSGNPKDMPIIASAFILDSNYSDKLSSDGRASRLMKAKDGKLLGSANIFGYQYQPQKREGHKIIDEAKYIQNEDSYTIKKLFETYATSQSFKKTAAAIFKNGKPYPLNSLKKIIDNPVYAGINNSLRYSKSEKSKKLYNELFNPDLDNPKYELSKYIDAIITPELFFECQKIKKTNTIAVKDKILGRNTEHDPYIHKIKCAYCNNTFQLDFNNGNSFYTCKTKNENGYGVYNPNILDYHLQKCDVANIYKKELLAYLNYLADGGLYYHIELATYNDLDDICYNIDTYISSIDNDIDVSLKNIDSKILELDAELEKTFAREQKATSDKLKELYEKKIDELDKQVENLQNQKNNLVAMINNNYIDGELEKIANIISVLKQHKKAVTIDELWDCVDYISISGNSNRQGGYHKPATILTPMLKNISMHKSKSISANYFAANIFSTEYYNMGRDLIRQLDIYYKKQIELISKK
ncbi:MAG: recombinase family protein [Bacillota bacterium]|nr:recombinase family protein [Bacillota bacterium]